MNQFVVLFYDLNNQLKSYHKWTDKQLVKEKIDKWIDKQRVSFHSLMNLSLLFKYFAIISLVGNQLKL